MKRKHIYLTDNLADKLDKLAKETGLTASDIVRRALEKYFRSGIK